MELILRLDLHDCVKKVTDTKIVVSCLLNVHRDTRRRSISSHRCVQFVEMKQLKFYNFDSYYGTDEPLSIKLYKSTVFSYSVTTKTKDLQCQTLVFPFRWVCVTHCLPKVMISLQNSQLCKMEKNRRWKGEKIAKTVFYLLCAEAKYTHRQ